MSTFGFIITYGAVQDTQGHKSTYLPGGERPSLGFGGRKVKVHNAPLVDDIELAALRQLIQRWVVTEGGALGA